LSSARLQIPFQLAAEYAAEAIGPVMARCVETALALRRLLPVSPFCAGGYDPVK